MLLKRVGMVLMDVFRQEDCVCRAGGDEFVILLPNMDNETAKKTIGRIEASLADHNKKYNHHPLSISIGTATAHDYTEWDMVIKKADDNMYEIKRKKKMESQI